MNTGSTSKRDPRPRYRPTGKCPLNRFKATSQFPHSELCSNFLHSELGSNQVGCSGTWTRSPPRGTNTGATKEIPALYQSYLGCDHPTWSGHTKATKSHILSGEPSTAFHHCGQTPSIDHMHLKCSVTGMLWWKLYSRLVERSLYPRPTKYTGFTLSVCPSVRLSVDDMVSGA